jgi:hypothetical protein
MDLPPTFDDTNMKKFLTKSERIKCKEMAQAFKDQISDDYQEDRETRKIYKDFWKEYSEVGYILKHMLSFPEYPL